MQMNDISSSKPENYADHPEPGTSRPVVVLTPKLTKQMEADEDVARLANSSLANSSVITSASNGIAVQGYSTDQTQNEMGYFDIKYVLGVLYDEGAAWYTNQL